MKLKKVLICALSAIMLLSVVAPAGAVTGGTNFHSPLFNGVRAYCIGAIQSATQSVSIELHFVEGENHLPEDDYYCSTSMRFTKADGTYVTYGKDSTTMSASVVKHINANAYAVAYLEFKSMSNTVHTATLN
jgi:hypothetical protein